MLLGANNKTCGAGTTGEFAGASGGVGTTGARLGDGTGVGGFGGWKERQIGVLSLNRRPVHIGCKDWLLVKFNDKTAARSNEYRMGCYLYK